MFQPKYFYDEMVMSFKKAISCLVWVIPFFFQLNSFPVDLRIYFQETAFYNILRVFLRFDW